MDYGVLGETIAALTEGETDPITLMATVVCEVHFSDARFDWTGFYRVVAPEVMKVGPYQGGHGCLVIPFSRGVCGAAARSGQTQLVSDVTVFQDHIACDSRTQSELVLPVTCWGCSISIATCVMLLLFATLRRYKISWQARFYRWAKKFPDMVKKNSKISQILY